LARAVQRPLRQAMRREHPSVWLPEPRFARDRGRDFHLPLAELLMPMVEEQEARLVELPFAVPRNLASLALAEKKTNR
jgi:hypothetical protein